MPNLDFDVTRHPCILENALVLLTLASFFLVCATAAAETAPRRRPYLFPDSERQRVLDRIARFDWASRQYEAIKAGADRGDPGDAALVHALEGGDHYAARVREHLLAWVRRSTPSLDADIAAGGHRENNMYWYWNTDEARWYDLVHPALSDDDRQTIETYFRKLGRYWIDSFTRWTTTPNLTFPIHYHAAVVGFCIDDMQLIEWGLRDDGNKFGPSRGGLLPVLDSMLRDAAIWDEAPIYAAFNVLEPMMQLAILHKLYYGKDLYAWESSKGASIKKLVDGYIALGYPRERTGVGSGSFRVATYGDGSTESPHTGHHHTDCLYLANFPWGRYPSKGDMSRILEQAYHVSRDPTYAWFLSQAPARRPSLLYGEKVEPGSVKAPPAPSSVFPEAGIAMLRSDESPDYWTNDAIAVLQMMGQGYGHDHNDKLMILMHAGGRLLYPDFDPIQYESANVNWTRSSIAHNTLIVDRGNTMNSESKYRHDFAPEVKFLATTASCYQDVLQTRALALTREYLLDLFWADSSVPHTYDWVVHAIGRLQWEHPALYQPARDLMRDYWWVENERKRETGQTWRADFVQQRGLAIPGLGRQTKAWFDDRAAVRVTMIGEPGTVVYGGDGPSGGPVADPVMNPEGNIPLLLARRQAHRTVFAVVHEPYKAGPPSITDVRKTAASRDAYVATVRAQKYTDRIAVAFGEQKGAPLHALRGQRNPEEAFVFRSYAYLRETPSAGGKPALVGRGNWAGFRVRCPELPARDGLMLNGANAAYRKDGDYVVFGDIPDLPKTDQLLITVETPLPEWAVPGQDVPVAWTLCNTAVTPVHDIRLDLATPAGCSVTAQTDHVVQIPAGGRWTARFSLRMPAAGTDETDGRQPIEVTPQVSYTSEEGPRSALGPSEELLLAPPVEVTVPPEPVRLALKDSREVRLQVTNWSPAPQQARLELCLPPGIAAELAGAEATTTRTPTQNEAEPLSSFTWDLPAIAAKKTTEVRLTLATNGAAKAGLHNTALRVGCRDAQGETWMPTVALPITVGAVLLEDNSFPAFGEYVIYAPRYTMRVSKLYGTVRFLRDDANRPRYEATFWDRRTSASRGVVLPDALPMLRIDDKPALCWGLPVEGFWTTRSPAAFTVLGKGSRLTWRFEDDAIRIEPVALWSQQKPHEFVFPTVSPLPPRYWKPALTAWTAWGNGPEWLRVIGVDGAGNEQELAKALPRDREVRFKAAMLRVPGFDEAICFAVDRPQPARFEGARIRFTVNPGEPLWFGFCRPEAFEAWRQDRHKE